MRGGEGNEGKLGGNGGEGREENHRWERRAREGGNREHLA